MSLVDIRGPFPSLKGRIALITGGSSGIGLATAKLLSSLSCTVLIADLAPPPTAEPNTAQLHFVKTNVTVYTDLLAAFDYASANLGGYPDIVFANAGIGEKENYFADLTDEKIRKEPGHEVIAVDLTAVANTVRIGWWGMKKRKGPKSIIMTASFAGYQGQPGLGTYNAAKHGVVGLLRALRYDAPKENISISLVAPAITTTPIISSPSDYLTTSESFKKAGIPMNTAERIAEVVVQLVVEGDKSNGKGYFVQGGLVTDLEKNVAKSRGVWMGEGMAEMYKGGKDTVVFEKNTGVELGKAKAKI